MLVFLGKIPFVMLGFNWEILSFETQISSDKTENSIWFFKVIVSISFMKFCGSAISIPCSWE